MWTKLFPGLLAIKNFTNGFIDQKEKGSKVEMRFYTPSYLMFARWLLSFGDAISVAAPGELIDIIRRLSREVADHHSK